MNSAVYLIAVVYTCVAQCHAVCVSIFTPDIHCIDKSMCLQHSENLSASVVLSETIHATTVDNTFTMRVYTTHNCTGSAAFPTASYSTRIITQAIANSSTLSACTYGSWSSWNEYTSCTHVNAAYRTGLYTCTQPMLVFNATEYAYQPNCTYVFASHAVPIEHQKNTLPAFLLAMGISVFAVAVIVVMAVPELRRLIRVRKPVARFRATDAISLTDTDEEEDIVVLTPRPRT